MAGWIHSTKHLTILDPQNPSIVSELHKIDGLTDLKDLKLKNTRSGKMYIQA